MTNHIKIFEKIFSKKVNIFFRYILAAVFLLANLPLASAQTKNLNTSKSTTDKVKPEPKTISRLQAVDGEFAFYDGDFDKAISIFTALAKQRDKDFALWNNQLGSIYLSKGDYKNALAAFLDAHQLMNDNAAFSKLETRAVSLIREEQEKAYKGDPYEKVYNSFYIALLLENESDYDNALAAIKNGILADTDVKGGLYKSDVALLYLLAARLETLRNDSSMREEYFKKATEAYYLAHPLNRAIVSEEQNTQDLIGQKQKELLKLMPKQIPPAPNEGQLDSVKKGAQNFSSSSKTEKIEKSVKKSKRIINLEKEIQNLESVVSKLTVVRSENSKQITTEILKPVIDIQNNTLFIIELGHGPIKYSIGQYGQLAVITAKPFKASNCIITIDQKNNFDKDDSLLYNDTLYQASTRGGRMMDGILKGKVEFKQTTAQISRGLSQISQQMANQASQLRQQAMYSGGASVGSAAVAGYAAAGVAIVALAFAIGSAMANPAADVRHWSLLPAEIRVVPMKLSVGEHLIQLKVLDEKNNVIPQLTKEFNINIHPGDNIIIKRIFE